MVGDTVRFYPVDVNHLTWYQDGEIMSRIRTGVIVSSQENSLNYKSITFPDILTIECVNSGKQYEVSETEIISS